MNDFSWPSAPLGVVILHGSCASLQMWLSFSIFVFHFYSWFFLFFFWSFSPQCSRSIWFPWQGNLVRGQMGITCLDELPHCWFTIHWRVKIPLVFCFPLQIKLGSFQSVQWGTNLGCFGKDSHEGVCKYKNVPWEINVCIWLPNQHILLVATLEVFKLFLCVFPLVICALFSPPWFYQTDIFEFLGLCYIMCFS